MKKLSKTQIIIILTVLTLIITNPTKKDWLDYSGFGKEENMDAGYSLKKKYNFLVFDIFYYGNPWGIKAIYLGVLKNFIVIKDYTK